MATHSGLMAISRSSSRWPSAHDFASWGWIPTDSNTQLTATDNYPAKISYVDCHGIIICWHATGRSTLRLTANKWSLRTRTKLCRQTKTLKVRNEDPAVCSCRHSKSHQHGLEASTVQVCVCGMSGLSFNNPSWSTASVYAPRIRFHPQEKV